MTTKPGAQPRDIKTVTKQTQAGPKVYRYHRKTGRSIQGEPGTPEFNISYREAAEPKKAPPPKRDTLRDLFHEFQKSPEWIRLGARTKYRWGKIMARAEDDLSWVLVSDLNDDVFIGDLYKWRDAQRATPAMADQRMDVLRHIFSWARKRRIIRINPAETIERLHATLDRSQITWGPDEWKALLDAAKDEERHYLLLALYTGARRNDLAAMKWSQIKDGWLTYIPSKTSHSTQAVVELPTFALPPLEELIATIPQRGATILTQASGLPWPDGTWGVRMMQLKQRAFPEGCRLVFHDIRGTTISRLYDASCSDAEVASITGHAVASGSLRRYAKRSRQLARAAYEKWAHAEFTGKGKVVRLSTARGNGPATDK